MEHKHRKIYDQTNNSIIRGGRINLYWSNFIGKRYKLYRSPQYSFKKNIDYLDQQYILKKYQLNGFEYGNYVTQAQRVDFLLCSHIALDDLRLILGFKNIGFNRLTISFGARGMSKAVAHFEPHFNAINLTKTDGWNSLAHEYGHFLDYYLGGYVEQDKLEYSLSHGRSTRSFIDLSKYKPDTLRYKINDLINSINNIEVNGILEPSETYKNMDTSSDYWRRRTEIFARFFENYVSYKLSSKKIRNDFLANNKYAKKNYITNADFKRVLPKMEKLMTKLRQVVNKK